jgi:hypothetical protein
LKKISQFAKEILQHIQAVLVKAQNLRVPTSTSSPIKTQKLYNKSVSSFLPLSSFLLPDFSTNFNQLTER